MFFFIRDQIMPVLDRAFEHVVPGIIPVSVPTISLPDLTTPGAASAIMPPNRTVVPPPPNYQVPAHSLRLQNAQGYQQRLRPALPLHFIQCPFPNRFQFGSEKNLTKFYKIFRTELDSVRKQKTIFKPRKNSEPNRNRFGKICNIISSFKEACMC